MARVDHTAFETLGTKGSEYTANAADLTMQAADTTDSESVPLTGAELVIAHNTDTTDAHTVTISSIASDDLGRTGDISYSLGADEYAVFGPFGLDGWRQSDGDLYFAAAAADVKFAVVEITEL
jgi:hypothetical protein